MKFWERARSYYGYNTNSLLHIFLMTVLWWYNTNSLLHVFLMMILWWYNINSLLYIFLMAVLWWYNTNSLLHIFQMTVLWWYNINSLLHIFLMMVLWWSCGGLSSLIYHLVFLAFGGYSQGCTSTTIYTYLLGILVVYLLQCCGLSFRIGHFDFNYRWYLGILYSWLAVVAFSQTYLERLLLTAVVPGIYH